jgi:hypothetical protein
LYYAQLIRISNANTRATYRKLLWKLRIFSWRMINFFSLLNLIRGNLFFFLKILFSFFFFFFLITKERTKKVEIYVGRRIYNG